MNFSLILILVVALLVLILGYNVVMQFRIRAENVRKQEIARYLAVINSTENLLSNSHNVPYSPILIMCLHKRMLSALKSLSEITPKKNHLQERITGLNQQIANLKGNVDKKENKFKAPSSDRQALMMLKLVKVLRETIRSEYNKGNLDTEHYVSETRHLELIQVRINVDNAVKRVQEAIQKGQNGTANQLIKKALDVLSDKNDDYSNAARKKLQEMLSMVKINRNERAEKERILHEEKSAQNEELDKLFERKKIKW